MVVQRLDFRRGAIQRKRLNWDAHVNTLMHEGQFRWMYRMSLSSFNYLLSMLRKDISVNDRKSRARTGTDPIVPEIILHCTLRYLAGGSFHDIRTCVDCLKQRFTVQFGRV